MELSGNLTPRERLPVPIALYKVKIINKITVDTRFRKSLDRSTCIHGYIIHCPVSVFMHLPARFLVKFGGNCNMKHDEHIYLSASKRL